MPEPQEPFIVIDWQPIATAPKDGTWIMVLIPKSIQDDSLPEPFVATARWEESYLERWDQVDETTKKRVLTDQSHWSNYEEPSEWAPLPTR